MIPASCIRCPLASMFWRHSLLCLLALGCLIPAALSKKHVWKDQAEIDAALEKMRGYMIEDGLIYNVENAADTPTGRGMVATKDIAEGEVIARFPTLWAFTPRSITRKKSGKQLLKRMERLRKRKKAVDGMALGALLFVMERRYSKSKYRAWIDTLMAPPESLVPYLQKQHFDMLNGTSIAREPVTWAGNFKNVMELVEDVDMFEDNSLTPEEADVAFGVISAFSLPITLTDFHGPEGFTLMPLAERFIVSPDASRSHVVSVVEDGQFIDIIASRAVKQGEQVDVYANQPLDNGELLLRRGYVYENNPYGARMHLLTLEKAVPEWILREGNCSDSKIYSDAMLSSEGIPPTDLIRCWRLGSFTTQGEATDEQWREFVLNRPQLLNQWPPPSSRAIPDWMSWSANDRKVAQLLLDHCKMRVVHLTGPDVLNPTSQEMVTSSPKQADKWLLQFREEQTEVYKKCVAHAQEHVGLADTALAELEKQREKERNAAPVRETKDEL
eukprot:GDKI01006712.1.p1 GENE.GDKI01006712.1~~GDKI01006712.1.p1  ORF type:complete len:500 (-),score=134.47 GDKI01006712.1:421-1920(-)